MRVVRVYAKEAASAPSIYLPPPLPWGFGVDWPFLQPQRKRVMLQRVSVEVDNRQDYSGGSSFWR